MYFATFLSNIENYAERKAWTGRETTLTALSENLEGVLGLAFALYLAIDTNSPTAANSFMIYVTRTRPPPNYIASDLPTRSLAVTPGRPTRRE